MIIPLIKEYRCILDMIMASFVIRRLLQHGYSRTVAQYASSPSNVQRQIIQGDGK